MSHRSKIRKIVSLLDRNKAVNAEEKKNTKIEPLKDIDFENKQYHGAYADDEREEEDGR